MPRFTEETIKRLCKEAITVRSAEDLHRVMTDLRLALKEHTWFARESLKAHASTFPVLPIAQKSKEPETPQKSPDKRSA